MVTVRSILRSAATRFLPTVAVGAGAILLAFDGRQVASIHPAGWALLAGLLLAETAGFATLLWRIRYRLDARADVTGRRSMIAGALGIVGLFAASVLAQGSGMLAALLLAGTTGAIAGASTFWPWVRLRISERELEAWEAVDVAALSAPLPTALSHPTTHTDKARVHHRDA